MNVNLSKFKIKSKDDKIAVLEHPDGHIFHVAIHALHPKMRKEIEDLEPEAKKMAKGGDVKGKKAAEPQKMAEGGVAESDEPGSMIGDLGRQLYAAGAEPESDIVERQKARMAEREAMTMPAPEAPAPAMEAPTPPALAMPQAPAQMTEPQTLAPPPQAENQRAPAALSPQGLDQTMGQIPGVVESMAGIQQAARAEQQQALDTEAALKGQMVGQQKVYDDYKTKNDEILKHVADLQQDVADKHIDPTRYMGSMSTGGRISTAIGLMLGGLAGGGQGNTALDFLNKQIDRDIDAQKAELGKKETLLSANLKMMGNLRDATDMTRLMMNGLTQSQIQAAAAKQGGPMAQARALEMTGQLKAQMFERAKSLSMMQMMQDAQSNTPSTSAQGQSPTAKQEARLPMLRIAYPEAAKEIESRLVSGVGMANNPLTEGQRSEIFKRTNIINATNHLQDWVKKNGASVDPQVRAHGEALAKELQQIYRQGVGASTSESEQKIIDSVISSSPNGLFHKFTSDPKLAALSESMQSSLNTLKSQLGLPQDNAETRLGAKDRAMLELARKNPSHPNAKLIFKKLGINE